MKNTVNYNLNKPDITDNVDIVILNVNMDTIDAEIKKIDDKANKINNEAIERINNDINLINFELKINGILANDDLKTVFVDKIENTDSIDIIQGYYNDGKVTV